MDGEAEGVGRRVRATRKLAGWTQAQLAQRAHVSTSLVKAVEQARVPASPAFVTAAARALGVGAAELMAQPVEPDTPDQHRLHALVPPLRRELAAYRLPPGDEQPAPRSLTELAQAVTAASQLRHAGDLSALGAELPGILAELRIVTHTLDGAELERAYGLLAEAYAAAGQVAHKLGYLDLSSLTTDRVEWAAARSGDELAVSAAAFYRSGELINSAEWGAARSFLDRSRHAIKHRRDEPGLSMWGQLHLKSGLAAARSGDTDSADAHLNEARDIASHVAPDRDDYRLAFNRSSVDIWGVGLAVEASDGTEGVKRAEAMHAPTTAPPERVGHHWIDTARAYLLHGDRTRSMEALQRARATSPQQTRHHPQVRETVRGGAAPGLGRHPRLMRRAREGRSGPASAAHRACEQSGWL